MGWLSAGALGVLLLILSPLLEHVLRLDSVLPAVLVALASVPLTLMGGQSGMLQGERRWPPLSAIYLALGIPRLVIGVGLILWHPTQSVAMLGIAIAALVPAVVGWLALRQPGRERGVAPAEDVDRRHPTRDILRETAHNSQALLAFFALSNADVVVARNALDNHLAGIYAAGLILAKAMMFLPQFVVVVAFPSMSTAANRRPRLTASLAVVAGIGVVGIAGAFLFRGWR